MSRVYVSKADIALALKKPYGLADYCGMCPVANALRRKYKRNITVGAYEGHIWSKSKKNIVFDLKFTQGTIFSIEWFDANKEFTPGYYHYTVKPRKLVKQSELY